MKFTSKTPNITQYHLSLEPKDELYTACMWAEINLDNDTYTMTATSDCGDYSYSWSVTPTEPFKKLMARLDAEYLLGKISYDNVFEFEESKAELLKLKDVYAFTESQMQDIEYLDECGEELFFHFCMNELDVHTDDIPICKRYPYGAQTFAKIFTQYLQPILRGELNA